MTGYKIITIDSLIESIGEEALNAILSNYSCPMNTDIEDFLHNKAVTFSRQGLAKTHLVFTSYKGNVVLAGYFSLANKTLFIPDKARMGASLKKRLAKFSTRIPETKMTILSAPLIAQLGKNYTNGYNALVTGDELLKMACDIIQTMQLALGGKAAYLECAPAPGLIHFYEENGFQVFSERITEHSETLVQMIRYF